MPEKRLPPIWATAGVLAAVILLARFLPHPPNFSPVLAIALFAPCLFAARWPGLLLVPVALFASDLVLGLYPSAWGVYLAVVLCALLGRQPFVWRSSGSVLLAAGGASVLFFLVTNFAVWASGSHSYAPTLTGLAVCYIAAVPFFFNTLLSTGVFALVLWAWHSGWIFRSTRHMGHALNDTCAALALVGLLLFTTQPHASSGEPALDGLWTGTFDINGKGEYDFTALHLNGEVSAYSTASRVVYKGRVSGDTETYRSDLEMYILDGSRIGSVTLKGSVEQDTITARFETTGGDTGTLKLAHDARYQQPMALEDLVGLWEYAGQGLSISINVDENGEVRGADSAECNYYGSVEPAAPNVNAFRVTVEIASCGGTDGNYAGAMYVDATGNPTHTMHLSVASDQFGLYYPLVRVESVPKAQL